TDKPVSSGYGYGYGYGYRYFAWIRIRIWITKNGPGYYPKPVQLFDVLKAAPIARLGYHQYTAISHVFDMKMPFMADDNVSVKILGGETGASDAVLYQTKGPRSEAERRAEEKDQRGAAAAEKGKDEGKGYRTERY
ncbi:hypothetical protein V1504DRAFT_463786, partial [Lipomyces starkeyi]